MTMQDARRRELDFFQKSKVRHRSWGERNGLRACLLGPPTTGQRRLAVMCSLTSAAASPAPCAPQDYGLLKNIGTGYLSSELSERLISSVRRQLPNISGFVNKSIMDLKKELEAMVGGWPGHAQGRGTGPQFWFVQGG